MCFQSEWDGGDSGHTVYHVEDFHSVQGRALQGKLDDVNYGSDYNRVQVPRSFLVRRSSLSMVYAGKDGGKG